jgi:hypothetical protein
MSNSINEYIDICIGSNGSHYDVSKVIYEFTKNKFVYCGNNIWKYDLVIDDKTILLKNEIKSNVINGFIERAKYWDDKSIIEKDINISNDFKFKSSVLLKIANKLKDPKFIVCIIKELKQFFPYIVDDS